MNSQVYYIQPSEKSPPPPNWMNEQLEYWGDAINAMPLAGKIIVGGAGGAVLGAGAVVLAPVEATLLAISAGAVLTASVFAVTAGLVGSSNLNEPVKLDKEKDAQKIGKFEENSGIRLFSGQYYVSHPRNEKILIPCQNFYNNVLGEQTSDIIAMIRNEIPAKEIAIEITTNQKAGLKVTDLSKKFSVQFAKTADTQHLFVGEFKQTIIPIDRPLLWADSFPVVKTAVRGGAVENFSFTQTYEMGLGISANLASVANLNLNISKKHFCHIYVKC